MIKPQQKLYNYIVRYENITLIIIDAHLTRFGALNYTNVKFNTKRHYVMSMILTLPSITRLEISKLIVGGILRSIIINLNLKRMIKNTTGKH